MFESKSVSHHHTMIGQTPNIKTFYRYEIMPAPQKQGLNKTLLMANQWMMNKAKALISDGGRLWGQVDRS